MKLVQNTEYWRQRAEEARTIADNMRDPEFKRIMTGVAEASTLR